MTLEQSTKKLNALIEVSKTINAHLDLDAVLTSVMSSTTDVMQAKASSLILVDEKTGELLFHISQGEKANDIKRVRMNPGEGIVGWVVKDGKPAVVNDVTSDDRFCQKVDNESGFVTKSILCVPLTATDKILGAIEVINKGGNELFDNDDLMLCQAIASQATIAIENAILHEKIVKTERLAAIGQTVAGITHCINNVLNGIQGGSYLIDTGLSENDNECIAKGCKVVKEANMFVQDLVRNMLTYSKERKHVFEICDIKEIIDSVCYMLSLKANEMGIKVNYNPGPVDHKIRIAPKEIRRCLLNLISNAIDACADNVEGQVNIYTKLIDDKIMRIKISDNGCGISKEDQKKVFQVFFSTKGPMGTGLGLAVTQKIILEHEGTITVISEPEQGTTFTIDLPLRI